MIYTAEVLDRSTGDLKEVSLGSWITVTELAGLYNVGPKQIRVILHHMGLLQSEGQHGWYRLTRRAVEQGLGKRINKSKSRHPFDVISPSGQALIDQVWEETVADLRRERCSDPQPAKARATLIAFKATRLSPMTTQEEVCWMKDHYSDMPHEQIASALEISPGLVSRYTNKRREQRAYHARQKGKAPPDKALKAYLPDEEANQHETL